MKGEGNNGEDPIRDRFEMSSSMNNLRKFYLKISVVAAIFTSAIVIPAYGSVLFLDSGMDKGITLGMLIGSILLITLLPPVIFLAGFVIVWVMGIPAHKKTIEIIRKDCSITLRDDHLEIHTRFAYNDKKRRIDIPYSVIKKSYRPEKHEIDKLWGTHPAFRRKMRVIPILAPGVLYAYHSDLDAILGIELRSPTRIRQSVIKDRQFKEDEVLVSNVYVDIEPSRQNDFFLGLEKKLQD
ncbi:MAG: hypothetical protein ACMUHY_01615 [Thermoplasmatota archaeon]